MRKLGAIVLSHDEAGDLASLVPWKLDAEELHTIVTDSFARSDLSGMLYLSTCNRVAFFYSLKSARHTEFVLAFLSRLPSLPQGKQPSFYQGREVVRHLLSLSAGLESMVLGETEIRAQLKQAYHSAEKTGHLDTRLKHLFPAVFCEARNVRASIPMNNLPLSVASLAMKKLEKKIEGEGLRRMEGQKIAIIGSGPMSVQAAEYALKKGLQIVLINRTLEKIAPLAARTGSTICALDEFLARPEKHGPLLAIFSATSAPEFILQSSHVAKLPGRPVLIDLAVPRDIDPEACQPGQLICMETLKKELEANRQKRLEAAAFARQFIENAMFQIKANFISAIAAPVVRDFQKNVRGQSQARLEELLDGRLSHLSARDRRLIYDWAIRANRDLNRIHRHGLARMLQSYYAENALENSALQNHF